MNQFQPLPEAIVGILPLHDYQTRHTTSIAAVALQMQRTPTLPGVMVVDGSKIVGVLSRQQLERWSAANYPRDLQACLSALPPVLELPDTCPIPVAVERAVQRVAGSYEPIVIKFGDGSRRLLDLQELLLAQMQIFSQLYQMSQYQQVHMQGSAAHLQQAQQRIQALQQSEQASSQQLCACQHQLAQQQQQLQEQKTVIAAGRDRIVSIKTFFIQSRRKALQSVTAAVDMITHRTNQMAVIGRSLAQELDHIDAAAAVVKKISQQSRFLGGRAAMLANRLGSEPEGLGQVTADFGHLSDQALKVGQQLDETGDRFKARLAELANLAQMGADATDILIGSVAESATLVELEHILEPPAVTAAVTAAVTDVGLALAQDASVVEGRSLKNQVCHNDAASRDLEQWVN